MMTAFSGLSLIKTLGTILMFILFASGNNSHVVLTFKENYNPLLFQNCGDLERSMSRALKGYKKYIFLIIIVILLLYSVNIFIRDGYKLVKYILRKPEQHDSNSSTKFILQYNDFFQMSLCKGNAFKNCEVNNCFATDDSSMMPIENFDAIIFNDPDFHTLLSYFFDNVPSRRRRFQKYIFFSMESPLTNSITHSENFYNWTMSYRKDADFYLPYAGTKLRKSNFNISSQEIHKKKKLVSWLVSNCRYKSTNYRMKYVKELKKYIPVDVYGECGDFSCPKRMFHECYHILDQNYKFYLSFENSLCKDYITEKFFNILLFTNMIPVVLGFADFKSVAPPNSYINVENFASPKDLADYLYRLSNNIDEYKKYLEWKKEYYISYDICAQACCDLCKKLHEPLQYSSYQNLTKWALGKNNEHCKIV